jgi:hypothetical protein
MTRLVHGKLQHTPYMLLSKAYIIGERSSSMAVLVGHRNLSSVVQPCGQFEARPFLISFFRGRSPTTIYLRPQIKEDNK